jgi:hypothetical protein
VADEWGEERGGGAHGERCMRRCGAQGVGARGARADLGAAAAARAGVHVLKAEGDQRIAGSCTHEQHAAQNGATAGTGGVGVAGAARWRALRLALGLAGHESRPRAVSA